VVRAAIQERCHNNGYQAGAELVEEILQEHLGEADGCEALPVFSHMVRTANRRREKTRPKNPDSLDFDLIEDCLPEGFLVGDIRVGEPARRHLMFATQEQLTLLGSSKVWYIDGTFRVVREPFQQLLSVHSFLILVVLLCCIIILYF
jgi:hypothetical protein